MKRLKRFGSLILELLRELSDENAYRRRLAAHGRTHSRQEWQKFSNARLLARYLRPKCC